MAKRQLEGEDAKMAKAIHVACEGVGVALYHTMREAFTGQRTAATAEKAVRTVWSDAADKIIDMMMEN